MAAAAEQDSSLGGHDMLQAVTNAFRLPDLRRRILFTMAILVIYRFLAHIPVPGVDLNQLR